MPVMFPFLANVAGSGTSKAGKFSGQVEREFNLP
jgi:hypothetical protein